jgi:hypothetical protein
MASGRLPPINQRISEITAARCAKNGCVFRCRMIASFRALHHGDFGNG